MIKHTYRKVRSGFAGSGTDSPLYDTQGLVFSSPDELKSYLAAASKNAEPNKTALMKQALEFIGAQIQGMAESQDADLEEILTFILKGWQKGDLPLDAAPSGKPVASPAQTPSPVVAQGARRAKRTTYSQKPQKLSFKAIKNQLRLRGHPF